MQKVGVIGLGSMGKIHLRNYCEMPDVEVVGVVDMLQANLDEAKQRFGVAGFASVEELLAKGVDAVSISVPTVLHYQVAMQVIGRGVSLLVEKPLAETSVQGAQIVAAAKERGVTLMVGHIERFNPAVERVKELAGKDLISLTIERIGPYPARIQDVGVVRDLGSHDIDLLRFIAGSDFKDISGVISISQGNHEDSAVITAQMENGVLGCITTNWVTPFRSRKIRAACKTRFIEANLMTQEVREYSPVCGTQSSYTVREWPAVKREQMREELTQFLAAVRTKTPPPITGEDGLIVLQAIEKIFDTCEACRL